MAGELSSTIGVIIVLVSVLLSITLHEAMHAFASHWLGDDTARLMGRLTLNPIKHIDPFTTVALPILLYLAGLPPFGAAKPVPFNPARVKFDEFGAALVGLAGPFTNLFLAIVSGFWVRFVLGLEVTVFSQGLVLFMIVNLSFFVFNMIPFPPLDGSRLLYALAPDSVRYVMQRIEAGGLMSIGIFILLFSSVLSPILSNIINWFANIILGF